MDPKQRQQKIKYSKWAAELRKELLVLEKQHIQCRIGYFEDFVNKVCNKKIIDYSSAFCIKWYVIN